MATRTGGARYIDPETWQAVAARQEGSWWPARQAWLEGHSSGPVAAPPMGAPDRGYPPLADAPGAYVLQE
jgi:polyhydroxyalkanoate synthase